MHPAREMTGGQGRITPCREASAPNTWGRRCGNIPAPGTPSRAGDSDVHATREHDRPPDPQHRAQQQQRGDGGPQAAVPHPRRSPGGPAQRVFQVFIHAKPVGFTWANGGNDSIVNAAKAAGYAARVAEPKRGVTKEAVASNLAELTDEELA